MIAVALVPPAATVGIGIAWGNTALAVGSGVSLLVNILSINLAALLVLWYGVSAVQMVSYRADQKDVLQACQRSPD
ncbi:DUF389 domain-containing protein [Halomicrobium urmianum]|uniref:DUF389 domain-containing protein n=1 Tax=Halomicrobium urmianum TaxID=1586233 RepID=UPI0021E69539|nr:DUF389 domain-containing protein [Halomicrobium urmianum]